MIQLRPPVPEDIDGGADVLDYREIRLAGDGLLPVPGTGQVLAPGVNDGAVSAAAGLPRRAHAVAQGQEPGTAPAGSSWTANSAASSSATKSGSRS